MEFKFLKYCYFLFISIFYSGCALYNPKLKLESFNYSTNYEKAKLISPLNISFAFDPKIDCFITNNKKFINAADSTFVKNLQYDFKEKLKKCNLISSNNSENRFSIQVNNVIFYERLELGFYYSGKKDNDLNSSIENNFIIILEGAIKDAKNNSDKAIRLEINHTTSTESDFLFHFFPVQTDNEFSGAPIEEQTIQSFAILCTEYIKSQMK